jgi:hypothetical protein
MTGVFVSASPTTVGAHSISPAFGGRGNRMSSQDVSVAGGHG